MKSFKEYVSEQSLEESTYEIPTTKAKQYKPELEKLGFKVTKADAEGLVISTSQKPKLNKWLKDNGWDDEEIGSLV